MHNDDALHTAKETLYRSIYEYSDTLSRVLGYYHRHNMLTDALEEVSRAIKLFELFKQSGYFLQDLSIYHESSALIHALRKEYDDALDELEAACKYALKCDTVRSNEKYKLFGNIVDEDNVVYNERKDMLAALLSSERNDIYAPIKDTQRYKDIIKALEES